ncbi:1412_t:CDS:2 [Scutellospora calospora]|uniref:1412_t:CDS:1 n=1 Tax=Scutellospora calospora TaxID=85575 RepID=A0ACA9JTU3_9GLOM|nr:1412_t:CDS:2 [Scutellospora calospora]
MATASVDDDQNGEAELADYKNKAKLLFKKMNENSEERCSIESGSYYFHYLEELAKEFSMSYGNEVEKRTLRPYAFVKFGTYHLSEPFEELRIYVIYVFGLETLTMLTTNAYAVYQNTRTQHNIDRLNTELNEVANIMTKNLESVLWRGEGLEKMSSLSDQLRYESQKYKKTAHDLNLQLLYRNQPYIYNDEHSYR